MGNLADVFIVRLKREYQEPQINALLPLIPQQYHQMFSVLWDHFHSLSEILDSESIPLIDTMEYGPTCGNVSFTHRYRGECLQQILRRQFFGTLLIIQNVYSPDKRNMFHVLREGEALDIRAYTKWYSDRTESGKPKWQLAFPVEDMITEQDWRSNTREDEAFRDGVLKDLVAKGYQVYTADGDQPWKGEPTMAEEQDHSEKSNEHARDVVKAFSNWVNGMGHENAAFVEAVMKEHRTLQQQMFEVMLSCIAAWANQEHYDARNEYTIKKCREVMTLFPDGTRVPFI